MKAGEERPQRSRRAPTRLDTGGDTAGLEQAIRKSLVQQRRQEVHVPEAPVFRPTAEEFRDPLAYIASIRSAAEPFGIAKVVPPASWSNEFAEPLAGTTQQFETKRQQIHRLQEGRPFGDGAHYTKATYKLTADEFRSKWLAKHPIPTGMAEPDFLEREYWRLVECCDEPITVDYANDLDTSRYGSGFRAPASGARDAWDLNHLIEHPENVLRAVDSCVPGVTRPWLYMGMLFTTFCWHKEDHNLYSINYLHHGASKTWYGVPGAASGRFEKALRQSVPLLFEEEPDLLHSLTTLLSPNACFGNGVSVVHAVQSAGEFMVTFPAAFHAGFSHGFNCAEAVNIGDASWLSHGRLAVESYRSGPGRRAATFAHEKLVWGLVQCCRGVVGTVSLPRRVHATILREAALLAKEQLHLRTWLQHNGVRSVPTSRGAAEEECFVCGTLPHLAAVRCACSPKRVTCLHHGFAMCECKGGQKALEIRIADQELDSLYSAAPAPAPVPAPLLAPPAGIVAATTVAAAATVVAAPGGKREREGPPQGAWKSQSGCYECGGRGGRGGLLRCLGCDAQFHGKCVDLKARGQRTEICLCGNCWDAQWQR